MLSHLRQLLRPLTTFVLLIVFTLPASLLAQTHVVSPGELQKQALAATEAQQRNRHTLRQALASSRAQKAMRAAGMDAQRVTAGIATLSDEELTRLASRAQQAQADFAAGDLSDRDLILILVGLAALILIIVAVR